MNKARDTSKSKTKKILVGTTIAIVAYVISLFVPLISAYTKYPVYLVKCGGRPVIAVSFAAGRWYEVPGNDGYAVAPFYENYYCSEGEALEAGYKKSRLN